MPIPGVSQFQLSVIHAYLLATIDIHQMVAISAYSTQPLQPSNRAALQSQQRELVQEADTLTTSIQVAASDDARLQVHRPLMPFLFEDGRFTRPTATLVCNVRQLLVTNNAKATVRQGSVVMQARYACAYVHRACLCCNSFLVAHTARACVHAPLLAYIAPATPNNDDACRCCLLVHLLGLIDGRVWLACMKCMHCGCGSWKARLRRLSTAMSEGKRTFRSRTCWANRLFGTR